jgi:cellobiose phosphorylase
MAMDAVYEHLNTRRGLMIHTPPYTGIPNPEDPLTSNVPGTGENGSIFCHAMTWAIIAECLLGNGGRAFEYYRKILPSIAADEEGHEHWGREPYVFASSVIGPAQAADFGKGGISWLTGTASWAYIAATQYLLGVRPTFDGLEVKPCLPSHWAGVKVSRRFRGEIHEIEINNLTGHIRIDKLPNS